MSADIVLDADVAPHLRVLGPSLILCLVCRTRFSTGQASAHVRAAHSVELAGGSSERFESGSSLVPGNSLLSVGASLVSRLQHGARLRTAALSAAVQAGAHLRSQSQVASAGVPAAAAVGVSLTTAVSAAVAATSAAAVREVSEEEVANVNRELAGARCMATVGLQVMPLKQERLHDACGRSGHTSATMLAAAASAAAAAAASRRSSSLLGLTRGSGRTRGRSLGSRAGIRGGSRGGSRGGRGGRYSHSRRRGNRTPWDGDSDEEEFHSDGSEFEAVPSTGDDDEDGGRRQRRRSVHNSRLGHTDSDDEELHTNDDDVDDDENDYNNDDSDDEDTVQTSDFDSEDSEGRRRRCRRRALSVSSDEDPALLAPFRRQGAASGDVAHTFSLLGRSVDDDEFVALSDEEDEDDAREAKIAGVAAVVVPEAADADAPQPRLSAAKVRNRMRRARANAALTPAALQRLRARRLEALLARTDEIKAVIADRIKSLSTDSIDNEVSVVNAPATGFSDVDSEQTRSPIALIDVSATAPASGATAAALPSASAAPTAPTVAASVAITTASAAAASGEALEQPRHVTGTSLRDYQLTGVKFLLSLHAARLNGILADEMGLGKTLQVLAFLAHLLEKEGVAGPHLIVAPLSVVPNWQADLQRFLPRLGGRLHVYRGSADERPSAMRRFLRHVSTEAAAEAAADMRARARDSTACAPSPPAVGAFAIVLTSYELVLRDVDFFALWSWKYLIVDEAHRLKNINSKLGEALRLLGARHRLLLTGTPLHNNLGELWALLNFCLPALFDSAANFEDWFAAPFQGGGGDASATEQQLDAEEVRLIISRLHAVLASFLLRRVKSDVLADLPTKSECILRCPMSAQQAALYERARSGVRSYLDPLTGRMTGEISLRNVMMRLRQICNHPYLLASEWRADERLVRASGKFEVLHRLLPRLVAAGHRTLIFSQMTSLMDLLEDLCDMLSLRYVRLDGAVKATDREAALADFSCAHSDADVFLLSTRAGGVGLNLQAADTVILYDSDWNPQMDLQAMARAHRIGQTKDVQVIRLLSKGAPVPAGADAGAGNASATGSGADSGTNAVVGAGVLAGAAAAGAGFFRFSRSVEEIMFDRAQGKLRTEQVVIQGGRFLHGTATIAAHARKDAPKNIIAEVLAAAQRDASGDGAGSGADETEAAAAGASRAARSTAAAHSGDAFAILPDAVLDAAVARDDADLRCFAAWTAHLASRTAEELAAAAAEPPPESRAHDEDGVPVNPYEWMYYLPLSRFSYAGRPPAHVSAAVRAGTGGAPAAATLPCHPAAFRTAAEGLAAARGDVPSTDALDVTTKADADAPLAGRRSPEPSPTAALRRPLDAFAIDGGSTLPPPLTRLFSAAELLPALLTSLPYSGLSAAEAETVTTAAAAAATAAGELPPHLSKECAASDSGIARVRKQRFTTLRESALSRKATPGAVVKVRESKAAAAAIERAVDSHVGKRTSVSMLATARNVKLTPAPSLSSAINQSVSTSGRKRRRHPHGATSGGGNDGDVSGYGEVSGGQNGSE